MIFPLFLSACQSETPKRKDPPHLTAYLACKVRYFENGKDTGTWTDGVFLLIDDYRLKLIEHDDYLGQWEQVNSSFQSIKFRSDDGKSSGNLNRLNGDLMVLEEGKVKLTGNCVKAVQRF